jgi:hypothetical protein
MKSIATSVLIILSSILFSQEKPLTLMESMCKVEVWNTDSSRFEKSTLQYSCYGFYEGRDKDDSLIIAIVNLNDTTKSDVLYYKVYEQLPTKFLHWTYRARDLYDNTECYIHHFRSGENAVIRIDYTYYIVRYTDDYWPESGVHRDR